MRSQERLSSAHRQQARRGKTLSTGASRMLSIVGQPPLAKSVHCPLTSARKRAELFWVRETGRDKVRVVPALRGLSRLRLRRDVTPCGNVSLSRKRQKKTARNR